jgi:hypothetical protein
MKTQTKSSRLGLSLPVLILLAALAVPRAIGHDLKLTDEGDLINQILVFVPVAIWIAVVFWKKVPKPFLTLLVIGLIYGVMLGIVHQLAWEGFWRGNTPHIGGNLAGRLSPEVEAVLLRSATFISSVITGILTGAIIGAIVVGMQFIRRTFGRK